MGDNGHRISVAIAFRDGTSQTLGAEIVEVVDNLVRIWINLAPPEEFVMFHVDIIDRVEVKRAH